MSQQISSSSDAKSRVLLVSMRNLKHHVSRCGAYELEDLIASCDTVDIITPTFNPTAFKVTNRLANQLVQIVKNGKAASSLPSSKLRIEQEYDLFFFLCQSIQDILVLNSIKGWREKCRHAVCWLDEIWSKDINAWQVQLNLLKDFDHVFMNLSGSINQVAELIKRPCNFLPYGVDTVKFFPHDLVTNAQRSIDIYSIGRRSQITHKALLDLSNRESFFYVYDTIKDLYVVNPQEHRNLYANLVKRSNYMIVNKAKFDLLGKTNPQEEVGPRFFEGAAGGAIMLGVPPQCQAFTDNFNWQDAVISVPFDCPDIASVISQLNAQPESLLRIRQNNVINSLLRHDWIYRWEEILTTVGLESTTKIQERKDNLQNLAAKVKNTVSFGTNLELSSIQSLISV
ncbi:glycosyltransferase [Calothrix sp. 336/3]|uniref:glycosyltransferase n=1 Tax=Calothrix sp. 336/3 TaxID=1337936 RepID=UPI00055484FD|nr:glycosyltransferase [Calothrix sp. 336/3]AKG23561.1 hypothetical protein IJ00_21785 [Calothrix sp. 336/3]